MESERLYINNKLLELSNDTQQFTRTLQVNDLLSLDTRQTNFTKNIKIPKTPRNILAFDYLGIVGNNSNIPYQKNSINYFIGNDAVIYNGWGVVNETNDYYNMTIYDGNIDLYKAIENTTLGDLNLSAITHSKDVLTVKNSWSGSNLNFKYIIADYGGKNTYTAATYNEIFNIDYLVPSIKVSYLWDKMFTEYGFTYSGSVFTSSDFTNLWLTYPKASSPTISKSIGFNTVNCVQAIEYFKAISYSGLTGFTINGDKSILTSSISQYVEINVSVNINATGEDVYGSLNYNIGLDVYCTINGVDILMGAAYDGNGNLTIKRYINIGDNISFYVKQNDATNVSFYISDGGFSMVKIEKYNSAIIDFGLILKDFVTKDFLNEIIYRFGLTPIKNKYTNNYYFKQLPEILTTVNAVDWSNKFISELSEKYVYSNYAQNNFLRYTYNDKESNYNDGILSIDNVNISDVKTVIQSKIYSPEKDTSSIIYLGLDNIKKYKLWDKEPKEDGTITYKNLDKRYYLLRSVDKSFSTKQIGSQVLSGSPLTFTSAPVESFSNLTFQEIVANNYPAISKVLNKSKIITVLVNLRYTDITDFDFSKLYYIKQLGNYYLVNKIINFRIGEPTNVELIKVEI